VSKPLTVAFQGELGANSHAAALEAYPSCDVLACATFEDAFSAVSDGAADLGMIPIENSIAGRVADVHHLLPESDLHIIGEHFMPIRFQLVGVKGAKLSDITRARSHIMALGQCRKTLRSLNIRPVMTADTAGAAREIAERGDKSEGALATRLAAEIHGLDIVKADIADAAHNTTRFVVLAAKPDDAELNEGPCVTSVVFRVRSVPAALYKALGGFATNGVNITKLESYLVDGDFAAAQFYMDIEGHPGDRAMRLALEELGFFSSELKILGVYKAAAYRRARR
jgi:prephenate dehydratase